MTLVQEVKWECENCGVNKGLRFVMLRGVDELFYPHLLCGYCGKRAKEDEAKA